MNRKKQIRVLITEESYLILKSQAKTFNMELQQYAGMILSGFQIIKPLKTELMGVKTA